MGGAHGWECPVRSRFVIPAAMLIAAAYLKGRWDADPVPAAPAGQPPSPVDLAAGETAATALAPPPPAAVPADALDLAAVAEWSAPVAFVTAPVSAPEAPAPAELVVQVHESGRFLVGGWAAETGHTALAGVTLRERREDGIPAERVRLIVEAADNVAGDGPVVLGDPGFAPDSEGFTLIVAAAGPGRFAAAGRYELLAA
jgi:hypothetical protein